MYSACSKDYSKAGMMVRMEFQPNCLWDPSQEWWIQLLSVSVSSFMEAWPWYLCLVFDPFHSSAALLPGCYKVSCFLLFSPSTMAFCLPASQTGAKTVRLSSSKSSMLDTAFQQWESWLTGWVHCGPLTAVTLSFQGLSVMEDSCFSSIFRILDSSLTPFSWESKFTYITIKLDI